MQHTNPNLLDRFQGSFLGLAVADALGAKFEAQPADRIRARFPNAPSLLNYPQEEIWYTDDTQMTISVAETLIAHGEILEEPLCKNFVANYVPSRGYGRGTRVILEAMEENRDYHAIAEQQFPGGSFGNGAAMRVAPVGLLFHQNHTQLLQQARLSALPTHQHPLGIEGAQLLALAVALAVSSHTFNRNTFFSTLLAACQSPDYRFQIEAASRVGSASDLAPIGNRIEALHSIPTAIASFALTPESYEDTITNLIFLGGDTDTLAAMAGALSGAYIGASRLPPRLLSLLENTPQGRDYLRDLATKLFNTWTRDAQS